MWLADGRASEQPWVTKVNSETKKDALLKVLFHASFKRGKFMLSSGRESDFYLDAKQTTLVGEGSLLVAEVLLDEVINARIDAIGGLTIGADPIIGSILTLSAMKGLPLRGFIVRKETKEHGTQKLIEGPIKQGDRVIIVEDVMTTGASAYRAVKAVEDIQCKVVKVIPLVDRDEGGREFFQMKGYDCCPLITMKEIVKFEKALRKKPKNSVSLSSHPEQGSGAAALKTCQPLP
jgi:orotate phosphoribosyltransferase